LKRIFKILLLATFLLSSSTFKVSAQDIDTNAKIKAVFIYNFTKYIQWPPDYEKRDFLIAILGQNDPMVEELNNMSKSKKVGIRPFYIREFNEAVDLGNPHIIYIAEDMIKYIDQVREELKGKSTLIITDNKRTLDGTGINFIVIDNRQEFMINKLEAKQRNLSISNTLDNISKKP
jgi:hypothetical protein